jgi:hypothetical protein
MTKFFDLMICLTMLFGIGGLSQSSVPVTMVKNEIMVSDTTTSKIDSCYDSDTVSIEIKQEPRIIDTQIQKQPQEWYAFENSNFKYDYKPIPYTEKELNLFTNVLYRESGQGFDRGAEINKYFVVIVGIMRILCENNKYKSVTSMIKNSGSFHYPTNGTKVPFDSTSNPNQYKAWVHCKEVVRNVLNATIPSYVPYIPYGTFCYWSDQIDTNVKQKKYLENRGICIATSVWNCHYYVIKAYSRPEELQYLIDNGKTCNPIPKIIGNGMLCTNLN